MSQISYTEEQIRSLDWREHIRLRPGMYIGRLGDGSAPDDGVYLLVKEIIDNAIDEFIMGHGRTIEIRAGEHQVDVRDYGRGIPLGKLFDCVARINTGGKYDNEAFQKSVGLNGVGSKVVNALSSRFRVQSFRDGQTTALDFERGELVGEEMVRASSGRNGTRVIFSPDEELFRHFRFLEDHLEAMVWNYVYLNTGLTIQLNGRKFHSENGLRDLLTRHADTEALHYPIIHLRGQDVEVAFSHGNHYGEEHFSFVNGQHTTQGGTHLAAFREALVKTVREFYRKDLDAADIRSALVAAVSVRIQEPIFESQTKTRLGSLKAAPDGPTVRSLVGDFLKKDLDDYLHRHPETAEALLRRIQQSERERKDLAGIQKLAAQRAKKTRVHNRKLRDCRVHLTDVGDDRRLESTLFITEGDSASGSLTQARDVETQAVFSLRGKPLNTFGLTRRVVYENEEFHLLQSALDLENGIDGLRYNRVVIATDADVDGMHIRLLLMTFFLQFFPDLARRGHVHVLETPLYRVRTRKETVYCYNNTEKAAAVNRLGRGAEITRFKGLGEISPGEFRQFIGSDMRLEPLVLHDGAEIRRTLLFYMGKNTVERQRFIIDNLRVEQDPAEGAHAPTE